MKATLDIDVPDAESVGQAVSPSLRDSSTVSYSFITGDGLQVTISSDRLGPLRGATNTTLMLIKLSNNVLTMEDESTNEPE